MTSRAEKLRGMTPEQRAILKQGAVDTHLRKEGKGRRCPQCALHGHFVKTCPWADVEAAAAAREAAAVLAGVGGVGGEEMEGV